MSERDLALTAYRSQRDVAKTVAARVRAYYGLPGWVKRGCRVRYTYPGQPVREGVVRGFSRCGGMYVQIRLDGDDRTGTYHPTWELTYISPEGAEHREP